jgi:hypothetical protein
MLATVYTELAARLAALAPLPEGGAGGGNDLPIIKWIDLYNAQPEFLEQRESFDFPAVFVEFAAINWTNIAHPAQRGEASIRLHVVQWSLASTYNGSEHQADALQRLRLLQQLHHHLHGWAGTHHGPLIRTATDSDTRHDAVTVDVLTYNSLFYDCPPEQAKHYIAADLHLLGEIAPQVSTRPAPANDGPGYLIPQ